MLTSSVQLVIPVKHLHIQQGILLKVFRKYTNIYLFVCINSFLHSGCDSWWSGVSIECFPRRYFHMGKATSSLENTRPWFERPSGVSLNGNGGQRWKYFSTRTDVNIRFLRKWSLSVLFLGVQVELKETGWAWKVIVSPIRFSWLPSNTFKSLTRTKCTTWLSPPRRNLIKLPCPMGNLWIYLSVKAL